MRQRFRPLAFLLLGAALTSSVPAAVETLTFHGLTGHAGKGKHPEKSQAGVLVHGNHSGEHLVCFSYILLTGAEIKGSVTVKVDVLGSDGIRRLARWKDVAIETLDLVGPDTEDDPCSPDSEDPLDFNYGGASECLSLSTTFRDGDILRYRFAFKKPARLSQPIGSLVLSASLLTDGGAASAALEEAKGLGLEHGLEALWDASSCASDLPRIR